MSTSKVEIIKDSVGPNNVRLTTFLVEYPRIVHGEVMTHRVFSRNASSSRAIPALTSINRIKAAPFIPIEFQKPHKGMQGDEVLTGEEKRNAIMQWKMACQLNTTLAGSWAHDELFTKQLINRITEPYSFIKVVITATEWSNFFMLRDHPAAEIHIQDLAKNMSQKYNMNIPDVLKENEWHLPFIGEDDLKNNSIDDCIKISVARCARTSYFDNYGKQDKAADLELYDRLTANNPKHLSPTEHQAQAIDHSRICSALGLLPNGLEYRVSNKDAQYWSGNLRGWIQYRKLLES
jgi:thymidylate synthase ThyX